MISEASGLGRADTTRLSPDASEAKQLMFFYLVYNVGVVMCLVYFLLDQSISLSTILIWV